MDSEILGTGALPSPLDDRDFPWEEVAMGLPAFDWDEGYDIEKEIADALGVRVFELSPKHQGPSGSCGGQAWATLSAAQEALYTKSYEERSAKFIYAQTGVGIGGSTGRANSIICKEQGVCVEPLCVSYDNGKPPSEAFMRRIGDITAAARKDANNSRAKNYVSISPDIDSIAQALSVNGGVVIGLDGTDNGTWRSKYPKPPVDGQEQWHHWMYVGKAFKKNGKKYLGVLQSWGPSVGDRGWQYLSEDYIKATAYNPSFGFERGVVWEAWTQVHNTNVQTAFTYTFNKDIAYGQRGEEVRALQMILQRDGSFPEGFDLTPAAYPVAYYGTMTAQSVLRFRMKHNIDTSTDIRGHNAGPRTRAKLNELYSK